MVLPFWCQLTQGVLKKRLLNGNGGGGSSSSMHIFVTHNNSQYQHLFMANTKDDFQLLNT